MSDVLIKVAGVSKKFCRSLKRSLWYGMQDLSNELLGRRHGGNGELREEEFWAVKDVSFELKRGECLGLIGRNGAGKTTLLRMLNGLIKPDQGKIEMRGRVGALIALGAGFNPILTGRENIYVNAAVLGFSKREINEKLDEIIDFAEIDDFIDSPVQSYSSGMQVRLGFAVASTLMPDILLLDEVLAVGDMNFHAKCWNRLGELRKAGTSFLLVSHQMNNIVRLADKVLYLERGLKVGTTEKEAAIQAYESEGRADNRGVFSYMPAGTGAVMISGIDIKGENGKTNHFKTGDSVEICISYQCSKIGLENPVIEISLRDSSGILFQDNNKSQGFLLGKVGINGIFKIKIPCIPSNNECIILSIAIWSDDMNELYDWKKDIKFYVEGYPHSTGHCHLPIEWHKG